MKSKTEQIRAKAKVEPRQREIRDRVEGRAGTERERERYGVQTEVEKVDRGSAVTELKPEQLKLR